MHTATTILESVTPYGQSKYLTTPKLNDKESAADYEKRVWRDRLHTNADGNVYIAPMCFKNCISEAAKFLSLSIPGKGKSTYTKHFVAGVLVTDPVTLPIKKQDVQPEQLFLPSDGVRGSGKRVLKFMPMIPHWKGTVVWHILDDVITKDVFDRVLKEAGSLIGIGTFRPINNGYWGRFKVVDLKWE